LSFILKIISTIFFNLKKKKKKKKNFLARFSSRSKQERNERNEVNGGSYCSECESLQMQSKINNFFKSPSDSSPATVADNNVGNDDLSNWDWENKQHSLLNTYTRTRRNPNPIASPSTVIPKSFIEKNKKRSYDQLHLDFGQSDFLLRACSICGVQFAPGNVEDEKLHAQFHKRFTQGIQFRVTNLISPFSNLYCLIPVLFGPTLTKIDFDWIDSN